MSQRTVHTRSSRDAAAQLVQLIPQALARGADGRKVLEAAAQALLKKIRQAFVTKSRGGTDEAGDRWAPLKPETIKRRQAKNRYRKKLILRDSEQLLLSLTPGSNSKYQVVEIDRGVVSVGTSRPGAMAHHNGSPKRGLPRRRLWPDPKDWPSEWWEAILGEVKAGVVELVVQRARSK